MQIRTEFIEGALNVYKNESLILTQPFKPGLNGAQDSWIDENDALDWWAGVQDYYIGAPEETPPEE